MMVLSSLIALMGLTLVLLLYKQVRSLAKSSSLKPHRYRSNGLSDLLNYAAVVDNGVIINKNGSLMAAWVYEGQDECGLTAEVRELISFRINQALANKGSGWLLHVDALRQAAPGYSDKAASHFPDWVSALVDDERRAHFEALGTLYESKTILTLTWFPPLLAERRFVELLFDDVGIVKSKKAKTVALLEEFKRECQRVESQLSTCFSLKRLGVEHVLQEDSTLLSQDHFLGYLQRCVTGLNHPVNLPKSPIYLDALIGGQELWTGITPKIGRQFIQCVAIDGFPLESTPGILNALSQLPLEYRWNTRFHFMDSHQAIAHLTKFRNKWQQKVRGFFDQLFHTQSGHIDEDALTMVKDANAALAETNSRLVTQGYYTSVVVLMAEQREAVETSARRLEKAIHALGFSARIETINTMDAFLGSLPGHGVENVRRPLLHTLNLADLLPTSTLWTGQNEAPSPLFPAASPPLMHCITAGQTPFRLNLHVRDLGHCIVFGPTRSGKSTLLGMIALSWRRYRHARIYAFDKGLSMYSTCKAVCGVHYTLGGKDSTLAFAPLQFLDSKEDRAFAMEWIDTILALNGLKTTAHQRNEIGYAILSMYQSKAKTLSEFSMLIQDETIRETLKQYTVDGLMGHLLDADVDSLNLADFITFEMEQLMGLGEKFALPVLLYLFRRIERSLDGRPTLISIDEAWLMFAHPVFCAKIAEWLDSMAKKNCTVVLSTQHLSHAANSGILDIIVESTASKIFLSNPYARDEGAAPLYARMGLNSRQIELIATAIPKRDYYTVSAKGQRLFQLALGSVALAFVGSTDLDSIAAIQSLEKKHGAHWPAEWLKIKKIPFSSYEVLA